MYNRSKKIFPAGTFIATPLRLIAIFHLCLAFTALIWHLGDPFMGEHFQLKSRLTLLDYALNNPDFKQLPESEQVGITNRFLALKTHLESSFMTKLLKSVRYAAYIPPYEISWIVLSIIIPVMLLKKREGSANAIWLLPLIAGLYGVDQLKNNQNNFQSCESRLFPSEAVIIKQYLNEPFSSNILEQREQLKKGWETYLLKNWGSELKGQTLSQAEYAFNLARIKAQQLDDDRGVKSRSPTFLLLLYFVWNIFFALMATKYKKSIAEIAKTLST